MTSWWLKRRRTHLLVATMRNLAYGILALLIVVMISGMCIPESAYAVDYSQKNLAPSFAHPFGTDYLGRDMLMRSWKGLSISMQVGFLAAFFSSILALILGVGAAAFGGYFEKITTFAIDVNMGIPHILLIMLIAVMVGGGMTGVVVGVVVTHWTRLTRIIRAEILQLRREPYILASRSYGYSTLSISWRHFVPRVLPQYLIGLVLLFPHAIMHEAGVSFLGYGLPLDVPAIGIILAESIKYLSLGYWWVALFPGLLLLLVVICFNGLGELLRNVLDPFHAHE